MATLADRGVNPAVVDDQFGRLTFTAEISRAIVHLLEIAAPYGTYNLSNDGDPTTWAGIARAVFDARGRDAASVRPVTTAEYAAGKSLAPLALGTASSTPTRSSVPGSNRRTR